MIKLENVLKKLKDHMKESYRNMNRDVKENKKEW